MFRFTRWIMLAMATVFVLACSPDHSEPASPDAIRVGLLPVDTVEKLNQRYLPLFAYISEQVGIPTQLVVAKNYNDLLQLFHRGEINMAVFGGVTFVKAHKHDGALPLVARSHKTRFVSYFLGRATDKRTTITDFKDAKFAFGSRLSTSGHLMPRYFLTEQDIDAEQFFAEVIHSASHAETAAWVRDGKVDIAAVNSAIVDKMFTDGRLTKSQVRIIWTSPPFPDQVFGIHPSISNGLRTRLRDAFLSLSTANPAHAKLLDAISADGFIPIQVEEYSQLSKIVEQQGLL